MGNIINNSNNNNNNNNENCALQRSVLADVLELHRQNGRYEYQNIMRGNEHHAHAKMYVKDINRSLNKGVVRVIIYQRPYHVENTGSRPITEVKQHWAWLVLGWVTAWEHHVLLVLFFSFSLLLLIIFITHAIIDLGTNWS